MLRPILRGAKISAFLLGATLVSTFIVIQSPRPTRAEGLLYGVTCVVRGLVSRECPTTPAPAIPAKPTTSSQDAPAAQGATTTQPAAMPSTTTPVFGEPLSTLQLERVEPMVKTSLGVNSQSSSAAAFAVPTIRSSASGKAVLAAKTVKPLEATEQGWRIFGALWYWWVIVFAAVFGIWIGLQYIFLKAPAKRGV